MVARDPSRMESPPLTFAPASREALGGYLRLLLRLRPGQAVIEVLGGTLSIAAAQPVVVALHRTALPPSTVVRSWPKRGLPGSK